MPGRHRVTGDTCCESEGFTSHVLALDPSLLLHDSLAFSFVLEHVHHSH